jgi:4-hydroxybenzoate polyprenyltransferase
MSKGLKSFAAVSRAEFLLPNLGSLIMGLAWGASPPLSLINGIILIALSFIIINLSSAIGAQVNTLSDYELDKKDDRKKSLVQTLDTFGQKRLRTILVIELILTLILVSLFTLFQGEPILLLMWIVGIFLGYVYSAPPLRLKARSWLAPISLILVLGVFPVLFAYYAFTSELNPFFVLSLIGLALTIYGVIVPTEIRDYFGDKAMGIETMTVRLGLVNASLLSIFLLATGAVLTGTGFLLEWTYGPHPLLSLFLLAIPIPVIFVLTKFRKLYSLSKEYVSSNGKASIAEEITSLSAHNPQWIMMVTQTYTFISILLLVSKFLI